MTRDVALALVAAGVAVLVASSLAAVIVGDDPYTRLHYITPMTSIGVPLVGIGLSVKNGWGLTTASVLIPVVMLFFAGPVLEAALARMQGQREGRLKSESPQ